MILTVQNKNCVLERIIYKRMMASMDEGVIRKGYILKKIVGGGGGGGGVGWSE